MSLEEPTETEQLITDSIEGGPPGEGFPDYTCGVLTLKFPDCIARYSS